MHNKLDIVSHHIETAIRLIAIEAAPASTHVLVHAAEEMLQSIAKKRGVQLIADWQNYVVPHEKDEFRRLWTRHYKWFKHANRATEDAYTGPPAKDLAYLNLLQTLFNAIGFSQVHGSWTEIMSSYFILLSMMKPELIEQEKLFALHPEVRDAIEQASNLPEDTFIEFLRRKLRRIGGLPQN